jgi:hypothetical protein
MPTTAGNRNHVPIHSAEIAMIDTVAQMNFFSRLVWKKMNSCQCNESSLGLYTDTPLLTQFQTYEILKQGKST